MQDNERAILHEVASFVDEIVKAFVACSYECGAMAGILAVESIDRLVSLTDGTEIVPGTA